MVGDALEIVRHLHRGYHLAQVVGDRVVESDDLHALLVDVFFELVNLLVVGDHLVAQICVAAHKTVNSHFKTTLDLVAHLDDVIAQLGKCALKIP